MAANERRFDMAYYMVLDTETCDKYARKTDQPEPWNSLVYDIGFTVVDSKTFEQMANGSFVVAETFNNSHLMNSSYYADKLPAYREGISLDESGDWQMLPFIEIYQYIKDVIKKYNIKKVWAYNCKFDNAALNSTIRTYSNGFVNYFFPFGVKVCDIWDYASCITATKGYLKFVSEHGLFSGKGNPKTSAEAVYAYITTAPDYIERHTAYEDALIECEILKAAKKKHTRKRNTTGQGWRDCSNLYHSLK